MFFVKSESPKGEFSPSYYILNSTSAEEAVQTFIRVFGSSKVAVINATLNIYLYEAGVERGTERELAQFPVNLTSALPEDWCVGERSYSHPQDYTVWHKDNEQLPEGLLEELETLAVWEPFRFPNGSNYSQQKLPRGTFTLPSFGQVEIDYGYKVRIGWDVWQVSNAHVSVGSGTNLGAHFNTRDQALAVFA